MDLEEEWGEVRWNWGAERGTQIILARRGSDHHYQENETKTMNCEESFYRGDGMSHQLKTLCI